MLSYEKRTGVWDIIADETTLPHITVNNLVADSVLKVTCQFFGRSYTSDSDEGYTYRISEGDVNLITLTPDIGFVQGNDSWQLFTHVLLFQVPSASDGKETTINVRIDTGDMNGKGAMMNFMLMAETIG